MNDESSVKQMQIKVLYTFNNLEQTYLSRSTNQFDIKTAQIPINDEESITLGACDLKLCLDQILASSPDHFKLNIEDYAVYYKDLTEQPDEPFVSNGVLSKIINSSNDEAVLIPGRVCQNLLANFLFGNKSSNPKQTLEIRLKLNTIEKQIENYSYQQPPSTSTTATSHHYKQRKNEAILPKQINERSQQSHPLKHPIQIQLENEREKSRKRAFEQVYKSQQELPQKAVRTSSSSTNDLPQKASRTLSLPLYPSIQSIQQADKQSNKSSRYNKEQVEKRFKFMEQQNDNNKQPVNSNRYQSNTLLPQHAKRTRSMYTNTPLIISSPINEESYSSDDPEYCDVNNNDHEDDEEEEEQNYNATSPYTPQQPPYVQQTTDKSQHFKQSIKSSSPPPIELPEDFDSKKTHTIPNTSLKENHGLICINACCQTESSIAWKYFETESKPHFSAIIRAKEFDKRNYEGMLGPLCNACFLFYKNKGFMRPRHVVRKYIQQQKYTQKLKMKEMENQKIKKITTTTTTTTSPTNFPTPSYTPSVINQVIQNRNNNNNLTTGFTPIGQTPDYNDLMNQMNVFGGPATDLDPLPGATPPMIATKSNTRVINVEEDQSELKKANRLNTKVINVYDEGEDKENCPPLTVSKKNNNNINDEEFESMLQSINEDSNTDWLSFFNNQNNKNNSPNNSPNSKTPVDQNDVRKASSPLQQININIVANSKVKQKQQINNMPSSPYQSTLIEEEEENEENQEEKNIDDEITKFVNGSPFKNNINITSSSPNKAYRSNTTNLIMSWHKNKEQLSSPTSDFFPINDNDK